jgi:hypothetical protein
LASSETNGSSSTKRSGLTAKARAEATRRLLQTISRNKLMPLPVRMRAAKECLPFEVPKLEVIAYSNIDPAEFARALDRALERSGKAEAVRVIEGRIAEPKE